MAYLTKHLPFAFMSCKSALASVHLELESAASILGASRLRGPARYRRASDEERSAGLAGSWSLSPRSKS